MKHIILTLTLLLFSVVSFGQKKVDLLDFLEKLDWEKSETYYLKKYKKLIVNETDSIADLHSVTGNWYLENLHVNGIEAVETSIRFDAESSSILVTSSFHTSVGNDSPFYKSIIDQWGKSEYQIEKSDLEPSIPGLSKLGAGNVFIWHNDVDVMKMLVEVSVDEVQGYALMYMTSPKIKELVQMLKHDSKEDNGSTSNTVTVPEIHPIDSVFFNTLAFGPDITEKKILDALVIATRSKKVEEVVNHIKKEVHSENAYNYTVDLPVHYMGIDWEALLVMSTNKKLFCLNFIHVNEQSDEDFSKQRDKVLNLLSKKYGKPEVVGSTYSWKGTNQRGAILSANSNVMMLGYTDFSCKSLEPVAAQKSIQTRFFGNLQLGVPITEEDVEVVVRNASELFLNNSSLRPENYISKDKISWNSMSYVIATPITFAGNQWDFVILKVEESKLASIEFQKSSPRYQDSSVNDMFEYWKDALIGKYGRFSYISGDNLSSGIYLWTEPTSPNCLTLEKTISVSKGGNMRCYLKLVYFNRDLINKQTNSIQEEF